MDYNLNLFPLSNVEGLVRTFRLLEVTNLLATEQFAENVERLVTLVAKEIRAPVCAYRDDGKTYLATTADPEGVKRDWPLVPQVAILKPDPRNYTLQYNDLRGEHARIGLNLLRFAFRTGLSNHAELWSDNASAFYNREAFNQRSPDAIDLYDGFTFRLHLIGGHVYVAVDPRITYIDRLSLLDHLQAGQRFEDTQFGHYLYRFGSQWYRVQVMGLTERTIAEQQFFHEILQQQFDVYTYTTTKVRSPHLPLIQNLSPGSPAIIYRYPNTKKDLSGAAALCFKTFQTSAPEVKPFHTQAIVPPHRRLAQSQRIVEQYFRNLWFNDDQITVVPKPLRENVSVFAVPDLAFGGGKVLHIRRDSGDQGTALSDLGKGRMELLLDKSVEPITRSGPKKQFLFVPETLDRSIAEKLKSEFMVRMEQLLGDTYNIAIVLYKDRGTKTLAQHVKAIQTAVTDNKIEYGSALLILPEGAASDLHNYIKRVLNDTLNVQCALASSIKRYFVLNADRKGYHIPDSNMGKFVSYTRYTALGMLLVNRTWPFAVHNPLYYDVYIGIDILNHTAGFTYVFNGGKDCYFRWADSKRPEKLTKKMMSSVLVEDLAKYLRSLNIRPRSIIIHRDGRSYTEEHEGLKAAVRQLQKDGLVDQTIVTGFVEIQKTSMLRLRLYRRSGQMVYNPNMGAYYVLDDRQGIVCNTGEPFRIPGTVNPLHVTLATDGLRIDHVLEDVFALAQLAWTAPDKSSRYPITTKLGDTFLRPIASMSDDEAAQYEDEESNDDLEDGEISDAVG